MSAPTYNAATDTLIHAANASDPAYASTTTMADTTAGQPTRILLTPSGYDGLSSMALVAGVGGTGKALSHTYPIQASGTQSTGGPKLGFNTATTPKRDLFIQFAMQVTGAVSGAGFCVKFCHINPIEEPTGSGGPQFNTIYNGAPYTYSRVAPPTGVGSFNTFWQFLAGYVDSAAGAPAFPDGHDQGYQAVAKFLESSCNDGLWHRFLARYRSHSALPGETVTVTRTADPSNQIATATFASSMAGKITNGQVIGLHNIRACTVSGFDGTTGCTLTILPWLVGSTFASGTTAAIPFTRSFDGTAELWVDDTLVLWVSKDAVGVNGGLKQWCGIASVYAHNVDLKWDSVDFVLGSVQSSGADAATTLLHNLGDGDPTNQYTLAAWTRSFTPTDPTATATQLLLSVEPAGAVSGVTLTVQPSGLVADVNGDAVTDDTSTVTASWVSTSGDAEASGTLTTDAVAGLWAFTDLALTWTVASQGHWHFADGSLTGVDGPMQFLPTALLPSLAPAQL